MTTLFKCFDCERLHDDHELSMNTISDPYGTGDSWYTITETSCPHCAGSVEEVWMCVSCCEHEPEDGYDECADCLAAMESE